VILLAVGGWRTENQQRKTKTKKQKLKTKN
jgi:hypothetical protein